MFYSHLVLARKAPLGKIWLAAHWEKKVSKHQVNSISIQDSVEQIVEPSRPLALRVSGHLLVGLARIYERKVKYLFQDCSDAVLKIKTAFADSAVVASSSTVGKGKTSKKSSSGGHNALLTGSAGKAIDLLRTSTFAEFGIDAFEDVDPDVEDDWMRMASMNNVVAAREVTSNNDAAFRDHSDMMSASGFDDTRSRGAWSAFDVSDLEVARAAGEGSEGGSSGRRPDWDDEAGFRPVNDDGEFEELDLGGATAAEMAAARRRRSNASRVEIDFDETFGSGMPVSSDEENEDFETETMRKRRRARKRRRVERGAELSDEVIQNNLADTSKLVLIRLDHAEYLNAYVDSSQVVERGAGFETHFQRIDGLRETQPVKKSVKTFQYRSRRLHPRLARIVDTHSSFDLPYAGLERDAEGGGNNGGYPSSDPSDVEVARRASFGGDQSAIFGDFDVGFQPGNDDDDEGMFEELHVTGHEDENGFEANDEIDFGGEAAARSASSGAAAWHRKTILMMLLLRKHLESEDSIVTYQQLAESRKRATVAVCFFEILQLKTWNRITLDQSSAYGDIVIKAGPRFWDPIPGGQ